MNPAEARIAYLLVSSPVANTYIGGVMVVDGLGLPVEFRYTEPIQPTKIQQILYGSVLSRYIKTDVILDTLLKSLEAQPVAVVVNDDSFLGPEALNRAYPFVRLTETKSGPLKQVGAQEKISAQEFLLQLTPETSPVRVQLPGALQAGSAAGATKSLPSKSGELDPEQAALSTLLLELGQMIDILEPVKRVEKALAALCQEAGLKSPAA